ncbi:MAG TPA: hypothetical protein VM580_17445, partial [Labilithrix sp.]|nr:hypothetical protein [Labilithrix sp.]
MTLPSSPPKPKELKNGRYTLVRTLGEGSQGETYEAYDNGVRSVEVETARRPDNLVDEWNRYVASARAGETSSA